MSTVNAGIFTAVGALMILAAAIERRKAERERHVVRTFRFGKARA